jgi:hypothetical protein
MEFPMKDEQPTPEPDGGKEAKDLSVAIGQIPVDKKKGVFIFVADE